MSEILKEAHRLYKMGFAVHWLHKKSKRPVESGWTSGPRKSWDELKTSYSKDYNVGVRLGTPSHIDGQGYLAVVDLDVKSQDPKHRREAIEAARKIIGANTVSPVVMSGRGNGSRHYYILTPQPIKPFDAAKSKETVKVHMPSSKPSKKEIESLTSTELSTGLRLRVAWEVSVMSEGRQVVLPPSIHPDSGESYKWGRKIIAPMELPVIDVGHQENLKADKPDKKDEKFAFCPVDVDLDFVEVSREMRESIKSGKGVSDRSAFLLPAAAALLSAELSKDEILSVLTDKDTYLGSCAFEHAQTTNRSRAAEWVYKYTLKKVMSERSLEGIFKDASEIVEVPLTPEEIEKQNAAIKKESKMDWRDDLDQTKDYNTKITLRNLDLIFSNAIEQPVFIKNLFANRIIYGSDTPWGGEKTKPIEDIDLLLVKRWLADTEFRVEPTTNAILEATSVVGHRHRIHPVKEYLAGLKWDGIPRLNTWLKDFCGAQAEEPYLSEVSRKFILAMVHRINEPGCQWDYVLVLEGHQGQLKSSIARAIASDEWFLDNLPDLKDKDSMLNLQGKWLIELGELTNVKRSDYNLVKTYLTRRVDTVRPHYGRIMSDVPRQSVFIGTVNEGQYLKDPTGNRRFWPVKVGICDVDNLKKERDQIFAEAVYAYNHKKEILKLSDEAEQQARRAQEDKRIEDDESIMKEKFIEFVESEESKDFNFKDFRIFEDLISPPLAPWNKWLNNKYVLQTGASVLHSLNFIKDRDGKHRFWTWPGSDDRPPKGACHLGVTVVTDLHINKAVKKKLYDKVTEL